MSKKASKSIKKRMRFFIRIGVLILVCILLSELVFRVMGYSPYKSSDDILIRKEQGPFFIPDEVAGYRPVSGKSTISLYNKLTFSINTDSDGFRITSFADTTSKSVKEIWIFGGSFAQGYGVNDEESFPYLLQQMYPDFKVRNFGVAGYGTLHSLLQLKKNLPSETKPAFVILAYGGFHNQRNVCSRYWLRAITGKKSVSGMKYPWARYDDKKILSYGYSDIAYHPLPFCGISAMMDFIEKKKCDAEEDKLRSEDVTFELINEMFQLAQEQNSRFLVAAIYDHPDTKHMLQLIGKEGIAVLDISVDLTDKNNTILEEDMHPNAKSHTIFANRLSAYLLQHK